MNNIKTMLKEEPDVVIEENCIYVIIRDYYCLRIFQDELESTFDVTVDKLTKRGYDNNLSWIVFETPAEAVKFFKEQRYNIALFNKILY